MSDIDKILQEIGNAPLLSKQEEQKILERVRHNDEAALEQLVRANMRFIVSLAAQYQQKGLSLAELIHAGRVGIATAAKQYEPTDDAAFISYATPIIRRSILAAISKTSNKE